MNTPHNPSLFFLARIPRRPFVGHDNIKVEEQAFSHYKVPLTFYIHVNHQENVAKKYRKIHTHLYISQKPRLPKRLKNTIAHSFGYGWTEGVITNICVNLLFGKAHEYGIESRSSIIIVLYKEAMGEDFKSYTNTKKQFSVMRTIFTHNKILQL